MFLHVFVCSQGVHPSHNEMGQGVHPSGLHLEVANGGCIQRVHSGGYMQGCMGMHWVHPEVGGSRWMHLGSGGASIFTSVRCTPAPTGSMDPPPQTRSMHPRKYASEEKMVNRWAVRILLECILVSFGWILTGLNNFKSLSFDLEKAKIKISLWEKLNFILNNGKSA